MISKNLNVGGIAYKKTGLNGQSSNSLMLLLELIDDFNRLSNYDELIASVNKASQSIMKAEASSIMLLDEERDELLVVHATGPVKQEVLGKRISRDKGFCGWVATHKVPLIANDIEPDDEMFAGELSENFTTHNLICTPLLDNDNKVIGVIEAINCKDRGKLNEGDLPIFQLLGNHAATAIKRERTKKEQAERVEEQDMYLTEIHHRVKNDLALISGIVEIESLDIENDEAKNILKNIQARIKSMAVVYELLSDQDRQNKAELGAYINKLAKGISRSLKNRNTDISIEIDTDEIVIDPYKALSCGLIINELILNSYKHAFKEREEGLISIVIAHRNNTISIDYRDDGKGLPEDFKIGAQDSLGFKMIEALTMQLEGTIDVIRDEGAHFVIAFENGMKEEDEVQPALKG